MTIKSAYQAYLGDLEALKHQHESKWEAHKSANRLDEAKFARIQVNIVDIFEKLFAAALVKYGDDGLQHLGLVEDCRGYFERIPFSWETHLTACERFGSHEEAFIERLKLQEAKRIRTLFESYPWEALSEEDHAND